MGVDAAAIVIKMIVYATALIASGGLFFLAIFGGSLTPAENRFTATVVRVSAIGGIAATIARILVLSAMLGDEWASAVDWSVVRILLHGSEGDAAIARLLGFAALAVLANVNGALLVLPLTAAFAVIGSFPLTGHSGSVEPSLLGRALVTLHLIGVSYWAGALLPLYQLSGNADRTRVAKVLRRFGDLAIALVGLLIAAAVSLATLLVGSITALVSSDYGQLLCAKMLVVVALLALATLNRFQLTQGIAADAPHSTTKLRRSIAAELVLMSAILALTATLTTVVGPPEPAVTETISRNAPFTP